MEVLMKNLKEKLGKRIQEIRKSKNITQEKLAETIDMETTNLSNIERGKKFMTADTLEKIINALDVKAKDLFDFGHITTSSKLKELIIDQLDTLSKNKLQYLYKTIQNLNEL